MFRSFLLLLTILALSFGGELDYSLKKLLRTQNAGSSDEVNVKVITTKGEIKLLRVPINQLLKLAEENLYVEAPKRLVPLNDTAISLSYAVFGNSSISVNTEGSFTGYIASGNVILPSNCFKPYPLALPNYFQCIGATTFTALGNFSLILKDIERNLITASAVYRVGIGADFSGKTGENVIVGVIDTGINFCHPAFLDANGNTRVKYFGFSSDAATCDGRFDETLGVCEYDEEKINQLINAGICNYDLDIHGTHISGIAAGYWEGSLYNGVAPKANLIVYRLTNMDDIDAIKGLKWIKQKSEQLGLPTVVNFSLGTHHGPHDGTSILSRVVDEVVEEGFIVVAAAGNTGNVPIHAYSVNQRDVIGIRVNSEVLIDGWYKGGSTYRVELCDSTLIRCFGAEPGQDVGFSLSGCYVEIYNSLLTSPLNGDGNFLIYAFCGTSTDLKIRLTALQGSTLRVDMWIANYYDGEGFFLDHYEKEETGGYKYTVSIPATAREVISVGAIGSKSLGDEAAVNYLGKVAPFSSRGPTRNGEVRPHVVAPGYYVCSANGNFTGFGDKVSCGNGAYYVPLAGTSMAAPFVTGLIALYLQDNPQATLEDVKRWLTSNTIKDISLNYPNLAYGYGKAVYSLTGYQFTPPEEEIIPSPNTPENSSQFDVAGGGGGGCNSYNYKVLLNLIGFIVAARILLSLWKRWR